MFPSILAQLQAAAGDVDVAGLSGAEAVALVDVVSRIERVAAGVKALAAARAAACNQWRLGADRSAAEWLARRTGSSTGAARSVLATAERLESLPATGAALRSGSLSLQQAAVVADAAAVAPDREAELLRAAGREPLRALQERAARIKAAAQPDPEARRREIHRQRSLREWVDANDVWHLHASGPKDQGAVLLARLRPFIDDQFKQARAEDRRESVEAYGFDALVAMSQSGGSSKPPVKLIARVDLTALRRGSVEHGEVCEIAGYGPIPVTAARQLLGEAALALVVTDGRDVVNVTHFGRKPTAHQQTALEWSQPVCRTDGCTATARLERDHRIEWRLTKHTRLDELDRLCHTHHTMKTRGIAVPLKDPP